MYKTTFLAIALLMYPYSALAGIDLPWSTTFDCADWNQYSDPLNCDGISKNGAWTVSPEGYYEQISVNANHPNGNGGKGARHWIGDGTNNNSGSIRIYFNTPQTKVWVRWYQRWEKGFNNSSTMTKELYFYTDVPGQVVHEMKGAAGTVFVANSIGHYFDTTGGFNYWYPGGISDGSWVCFEVSIDIPGQSYKYWVNGQLLLDEFMDYQAVTQLKSMIFQVNSKTVANGRSMYVDYDDIAISNTGYIGPLAGGALDTSPPSVSLSAPIQGQTVSGDVTLSASATDNVGVAGVQFKIDGIDTGVEDTTSPYSINLDTTALADGSHTLTAMARDAAGNQTTSTTVGITVNNSNNSGGAGTVLFSESFEDTNFTARGWYDNTNLQLSSTEHIPGSTQSLEFHFDQGATQPTSGGAVRKKFTETDQIYVSYYVKYNANWEGSNQSYHPHEFMILTNLDGDWSNLASTHLTTYIEQNEGEPLLAIQDSLNIDPSNINTDLTSITENRGVAGCNGDSDGYGNGDCYSANGYKNGKYWRAGSIYFQDNPGSYYKNDWHFVEAFIKLNSITNTKANADGILQYWYDGQLIIDHSDVVLRTGQHPNMLFNQFIIGPYIGDGSPVAQTFWIDNLSLATGRPMQNTPSVAPPDGFQLITN